jgi:hypothetical protein
VELTLTPQPTRLRLCCKFWNVHFSLLSPFYSRANDVTRRARVRHCAWCVLAVVDWIIPHAGRCFDVINHNRLERTTDRRMYYSFWPKYWSIDFTFDVIFQILRRRWRPKSDPAVTRRMSKVLISTVLLRGLCNRAIFFTTVGCVIGTCYNGFVFGNAYVLIKRVGNYRWKFFLFVTL